MTACKYSPVFLSQPCCFNGTKSLGLCWHAADPVDTSHRNSFCSHAPGELKRAKKSSWSASGKPPGRPTDNAGGRRAEKIRRGRLVLCRGPRRWTCARYQLPSTAIPTEFFFFKRKSRLGSVSGELGKCLHEDRTSKACIDVLS